MILPELLFYNCDDPVRVIKAGCIKPSSVFTGVSLSDWSELGSHGPFKISFKRTSWFNQLIKVRYWRPPARELVRRSDPSDMLRPEATYEDESGNRLNENDYRLAYNAALAEFEEKVGSAEVFPRVWKESFMFRDEHEWYSPTAITFTIGDIARITFMKNAPIIKPRICRQSRRLLALHFAELYEERVVDDPYLARRRAV